MVLKFKRCQILLLLFLLAYPHFVDAVRNDGRRSSRRTYTMTCKLPQAFSGGDGLMRGMSFGVPEEAQRIRIIGPKFKVTFDSTIVPDLVAALERSEASASAACDPGPGGDLWNNGPADLKRMAHAVLVFRSEVHQDGSVREPLGHGMALFGGRRWRQRESTWQTATMPNRSHAATR